MYQSEVFYVTFLFSSVFLGKMAFGEHGTETLVTESRETVSGVPERCFVVSKGVTITRCCGQLLCVDCKNKCLRLCCCSGCPHCRSTIDRITVFVNIRTFHQATLVLNGNG